MCWFSKMWSSESFHCILYTCKKNKIKSHCLVVAFWFSQPCSHFTSVIILFWLSWIKIEHHGLVKLHVSMLLKEIITHLNSSATDTNRLKDSGGCDKDWSPAKHERTFWLDIIEIKSSNLYDQSQSHLLKWRCNCRVLKR